MKVQFTKESPADFPGAQQVQLMFSPLNQVTASVFFWQGPRRATFSEVLNTFCVKNIFKRLNAADLSEVSITCRRFNAIAKKVFKKIPEHQQHQYESVMLRPISQVESFFRQFGSNVTVLDTNKFQSQNVILGMVVRYCRNLKELQCTVCNQQTLTELKSIVGRLEKFDLLCSSDVVFYGNEMFTSCSPLRIWKLEHNGKTILPQIKLKHLFDLQLSSMYLPDEKTVCEFFKKNSQLQRLHLERVWTCSGFEHILWPLDNLEELTLFDFASRLYRSNSPCFEKMKRLSKLRLWAEVCDFNGILKVLNYSEVSVEYDRSMATTDNLTEMDRSRMVTGLKLNKSFSSTHMYRGNWITNSMLEHAIQNLPGLQDFLVESVRISLDGILSTLEYGLRLRKAVFIIKKRVAMFAPHEHVLQLVSDIRVIAEIRKIQVSIEMVEEANSKPNVSYFVNEIEFVSTLVQRFNRFFQLFFILFLPGARASFRKLQQWVAADQNHDLRRI